MEPDLSDDATREPTAADTHNFTKHSDPVVPVSSEEEVVTDASNVVSVVPLPERKQVVEIKLPDGRHTADIKQSAINSLSAEDFYEGDL